MKVIASSQVPAQEVQMEGARGCRVRWLVDRRDGAPRFAMREFEIAPGGYTPKHHHPYEHEVYILSGQGEVLQGDEPRSIRTGDVIYIAPDEVHQFRNSGQEPLRFL